MQAGRRRTQWTFASENFKKHSVDVSVSQIQIESDKTLLHHMPDKITEGIICRSGLTSDDQISSAPPGLESATSKLSLEEKAIHEEPLSKAQAKRLRKKLREGRAEV